MKGGAAAIDRVPDGVDSLEWMKGVTLSDPSPGSPLVLDLSLESGLFRGAIIDGFLTLYHRKLMQILSEFKIENIQHFPVILRDQETGKTEETYVMVNIIGLIDCVDMDKSKVRWWPSGMGYDFESMYIDGSKVHGLHIFRLKDDPAKVIISEELKQHLETHKMLVGTKVIKTEDYSDW
ncbi:MAG: hypothetical protein OEX19_11255 [Gammaproteobacteria bacterium]|nr:hypothetical protein [Gammaproteobacteria bacterium]